jgi:hypothetical protein
MFALARRFPVTALTNAATTPELITATTIVVAIGLPEATAADARVSTASILT